MRVKPKLFPTHFNLVLDAGEHVALDNLFDLDPYLEDERELLHKALRAGIKALNHAAETRRKDPQQPTRTEVQTAKSAATNQIEEKLSLHFPKSVELDLSPEQRDGLDYLADRVPHASDLALIGNVISLGISTLREEIERDAAKNNASSTSEAPGLRNPRPVENYLGVPIQERLRHRLEEFLADCPGIVTDEEAFAMLIDLGLDHAEGQPVSKVLDRAKRAARSRRKFARAGLRLVRR